MVELKNKPRVFLSHSKKDEAFVNKIYEDLRRCQIDPWLDSIDIRHGQPWLDEIFENGIPTCDSILVYLTENSLQSAMVKKEIDTSIIRKLKDNKIGFLPYVSGASLREKLRPDLQTLQIPEWNMENYSNLLPRVVSEVWQSYLEKKVSQSIADERVQRLELQLELESIKHKLTEGVFAQAEESDFDYIWETMNRSEKVEFYSVSKSDDEGVLRFSYRFCLRSVLPFLATSSNYEYYSNSVNSILLNQKPSELSTIEVLINMELDIANELLMFGLLERRELPRPSDSSSSGRTRAYFVQDSTIRSLAYTSKFDRFKYWLAYKKFMPKSIEWQSNS